MMDKEVILEVVVVVVVVVVAVVAVIVAVAVLMVIVVTVVGTSVLDDVPIASAHLRVAHQHVRGQVPLLGDDVCVVELVRQAALVEEEDEIHALGVHPDARGRLPSPRVAYAEDAVGGA